MLVVVTEVEVVCVEVVDDVLVVAVDVELVDDELLVDVDVELVDDEVLLVDVVVVAEVVVVPR